MRTSIAELLALLDPERAAARVVAGGEGLQEVEDVRVLFSLSPPPPASGILWVLPDLDSLASVLLDALLLELHRQGAAGLVVPRGRVVPHGRLVESTRLLATRLDLTLVTIAIEHLDESLRTWRRHIDALHLADLKRVADLKSALLDAWLAAPSLETYLDSAGRVLGGRIAFADAAVDPAVAEQPYRHSVEVPWGKGLGTALAIDLPHDLDDEVLPDLLRHVASLVAMRIDREVVAIESNIRVRGEFLLELLVSESPGGSVIRAAEHFGLDLGRKHFVALWDIDDFTTVSHRPDMHEVRILHLKQDLVEHLESSARRRFPRVWVLPHSDEFVLIAESEGRDREPNQVYAAMADLRADLQQLLRSYGLEGISAGVGFAYAGSGGLRKSFEEAREALLVGTSQFGPDSITHFSDLGIHRFLYGWMSSPRSRDLAQDFMRPLIQDDRRSSADLLRTLRVHLNARDKSAAARQLGIHRNTLNYRLGRIEELLHIDLSDPSVRLVLHLLVRALPEPNTAHQN